MLMFSDSIKCDAAESDGSIYAVTDKMTCAVNSEQFFSASLDFIGHVLQTNFTFGLWYFFCCRSQYFSLSINNNNVKFLMKIREQIIVL